MSWTFETVNIPPAGHVMLQTGQGAVCITDIGSTKVAGLPTQSWGLLINYKALAWVFGYEGGGRISLTIDASGNLAPTGNGTMTPLTYVKK